MPIAKTYFEKRLYVMPLEKPITFTNLEKCINLDINPDHLLNGV